MHSPAEFEACIAALWVFPVKSCAGISVPHAVLTPTGLAHDRGWMVVDADGDMVTQRELPRMALIQPELVYSGATVCELVLHAPGMTALHLSLTVEGGASIALANTSTTSKAQAIEVRVWDDQVPAFDMGPPVSAWLNEFLGSSLGTLRLVRFDENHQRSSSAKWTQGLRRSISSAMVFRCCWPVPRPWMNSMHACKPRARWRWTCGAFVPMWC